MSNQFESQIVPSDSLRAAQEQLRYTFITMTDAAGDIFVPDEKRAIIGIASETAVQFSLTLEQVYPQALAARYEVRDYAAPSEHAKSLWAALWEDLDTDRLVQDPHALVEQSLVEKYGISADEARNLSEEGSMAAHEALFPPHSR